MNTDYVIMVLSGALVLVTLYYAWATHKILKEQRKTAELAVMPFIGFYFRRVKENFSFHVSADVNSLFNLIARVFVNGTFKDEKNIGNAIFRPGKEPQNTHAFDFTSCLDNIEKDRNFTLSIEISYEIRTGSRVVERYTWREVKITQIGDLKIRGGYPDERAMVSAPWQ